jgi:hypothetical protein
MREERAGGDNRLAAAASASGRRSLFLGVGMTDRREVYRAIAQFFVIRIKGLKEPIKSQEAVNEFF